ncbi:MAG: alkaline phosphatase family protein [Candidatus Ranarchaeia archaeon]
MVPSLTAPALASIHLGCPPESHGIVGNLFYVPDHTKNLMEFYWKLIVGSFYFKESNE